MQEIVNYIDRSLQFDADYTSSSCLVFRVKRENDLYILKIALNEYDRDHLNRESRALEMAQSVDGITHLIDDYTKTYHRAILKEYAEGTTLDFNQQLNDALYCQVEDTVNSLHNIGIANLDISPRNIVISPDETQATIIDIGGCLIRGFWLPFFVNKYIDNISLEQLTSCMP